MHEAQVDKGKQITQEAQVDKQITQGVQLDKQITQEAQRETTKKKKSK